MPQVSLLLRAQHLLLQLPLACGLQAHPAQPQVQLPGQLPGAAGPMRGARCMLLVCRLAVQAAGIPIVLAAVKAGLIKA